MRRAVSQPEWQLHHNPQVDRFDLPVVSSRAKTDTRYYCSFKVWDQCTDLGLWDIHVSCVPCEAGIKEKKTPNFMSEPN